MELVEVVYKCGNSHVRSVEQLFDSFVDAELTVGEVNRLESESGTMAERLIDSIFSSNQTGLQKILLRDLVIHLSGIADRAEVTGDRVRIIVA